MNFYIFPLVIKYDQLLFIIPPPFFGWSNTFSSRDLILLHHSSCKKDEIMRCYMLMEVQRDPSGGPWAVWHHLSLVWEEHGRASLIDLCYIGHFKIKKCSHDLIYNYVQELERNSNLPKSGKKQLRSCQYSSRVPSWRSTETTEVRTGKRKFGYEIR